MVSSKVTRASTSSEVLGSLIYHSCDSFILIVDLSYLDLIS